MRNWDLQVQVQVQAALLQTIKRETLLCNLCAGGEKDIIHLDN